MKPVVVNLTEEGLIAIVALLASANPKRARWGHAIRSPKKSRAAGGSRGVIEAENVV